MVSTWSFQKTLWRLIDKVSFKVMPELIVTITGLFRDGITFPKKSKGSYNE